MLVDMVVVMGDVFASVYNFHSPLSSKVDLSIQRDCNVYFINSLLLVCWLFFYSRCCVYSGFFFFLSVCIGLASVLWCVSVYWWSYYALDVTVCPVPPKLSTLLVVNFYSLSSLQGPRKFGS
jgi:hypothetical protein